MKRALVLSGGTALGAVQVYPIEQMMEKYGIDSYSIVLGVSVGAVNGAMFAQNKLPRLRALYNKVRGTGFFMVPNLNPFGMAGVMTLNPLRKRLKKNVKLADFVVPYGCGVVDYETDTYLNIYQSGLSKNRHLWDSICASAAQPVLNHGYRIPVPPGDKHLCFDGGVKHVVPQLQNPAQYDAIDVVLCEPFSKLQPKTYTQLNQLPEVAERTFKIMINENVLFNDLKRVVRWSKKSHVTVYAPLHHDDEFDASKKAIRRRLNKVGPWMWEHPYKPGDYLKAFEDARRS